MISAYRESHVRRIVDEDSSKYVPALWRLLVNPGNLLWFVVGPAFAMYVVTPVMLLLQWLTPSGWRFVEAHWRAFVVATVVISAVIGALRDALLTQRAIRESVEQSVRYVRHEQEQGRLL